MTRRYASWPPWAWTTVRATTSGARVQSRKWDRGRSRKRPPRRSPGTPPRRSVLADVRDLGVRGLSQLLRVDEQRVAVVPGAAQDVAMVEQAAVEQLGRREHRPQR